MATETVKRQKRNPKESCGLKSCKRAVLQKFPEAFCLFFPDGEVPAKYEIWLVGQLIVRGPTAAKAWEFAANKLKI